MICSIKFILVDDFQLYAQLAHVFAHKMAHISFHFYPVVLQKTRRLVSAPLNVKKRALHPFYRCAERLIRFTQGHTRSLQNSWEENPKL